MKRLTDRLRHLTDLLGEDHDLAVLRVVVPGACIDDVGIVALIDHHREALQGQAFGAGDKIYKGPPGVFLARFAHYWKKSRRKAIEP
jgi:hypothetical protein